MQPRNNLYAAPLQLVRVHKCRMMLEKFNLTGETQERERILIPFSNRYHECNIPEYGSPGIVLSNCVSSPYSIVF